ncbi:hypothetical protein [Burkholderia sp. 3C]
MNSAGTGSLPVDLARHRAYARIFQPGRLTGGLIAPLEGRPDSPAPTRGEHAALARQADDALGFAAIWLRDVPFLASSVGDVGHMHDPMIYAG